TQYCDSASTMCKARLCTPNQPSCNGTILATCNADGSGYLAGGVDCAPRACSGGACVDVIFSESFEGSFDRWTLGTGTYTRWPTATPGAAGTTYALTQTKTGVSGGPGDGISYSFASPVQPRAVSYWVKTTNTAVATTSTFRLMNGTEIIYY